MDKNHDKIDELIENFHFRSGDNICLDL